MSRSPLSRPQSLLAAGGMCAVSLVFLLFIASPVQAALGMTGLLLTELGLLALALGGAKLLGEPLRTVFPLARPRLRPTAGAVVLWLGIYAPVLLVSGLCMGSLTAAVLRAAAPAFDRLQRHEKNK